MARLEREIEVSPERIWGSEARIPTIVGQGSGRGFELENVHLPRKWEKAIPHLKTHTQEQLQGAFNNMCEAQHVTPGILKLDPKTHLVTSISAGENGGSRVRLADSYTMQVERGEYVSSGIKSIYEAITLEKFMANYLSIIAQECGSVPGDVRPYQYIDGGGEGRGYASYIYVPRRLVTGDEPITGDNYQRNFALDASNIAGTFGLKLGLLQFTDTGVLHSVNVTGNACTYSLSTSDNAYGGHNVDTPYQAAALHGITSLFVNDLLASSERDSDNS